MDILWSNYLKTLEEEVGEDLARAFVETLYKSAEGCPRKALGFFYNLGRAWSPLMYAWQAWVNKHAQGTIAIVLRDAKPLIMFPETAAWKQLYLNRVTCGIPDELSGSTVKEPHHLLKRYLDERQCGDPFTFVDSGCYGTIVLALHQLGISFLPLFFFSKNGHIPGFLNELGLTEEEGTILNDSLECAFPHRYRRPSALTEMSGRVDVALEESDRLSIQFGWAALSGVGMAPKSQKPPELLARDLLELSRQSREGHFTGILSRPSPEWSKKAEFLATWPQELSWT